MFNWDFRLLSPTLEDKALPSKIHRVYLDGFGLKKGWSLEGVESALARCDALGLLLDSGNEICGYAFYSCPRERLRGRWLLWEDAIGLEKRAQGLGLSEAALAAVWALYPERTFGWIGGRTQNPIVMKRYAHFGPVFPFDYSYSEGEGPEVMSFLRTYIAEARDVPQLDPITGICSGVYRSGRLGDYAEDIDGGERFEVPLRQWNFQRLRGDAILVVARIGESWKYW